MEKWFPILTKNTNFKKSTDFWKNIDIFSKCSHVFFPVHSVQLEACTSYHTHAYLSMLKLNGVSHSVYFKLPHMGRLISKQTNMEAQWTALSQSPIL